jgi:hypothetical protein
VGILERGAAATEEQAGTRLLERGAAAIEAHWEPGSCGATLVIGLLACLPPLLRALRIRPVDVLKEV